MQHRAQDVPRPRRTNVAGSASGDEAFTERMDSILRAAEEEAAEIRQTARNAAQAAYNRAASEVADLVNQRDAVLAELITMRKQIEGIVPIRSVVPPAPSNPPPTSVGSTVVVPKQIPPDSGTRSNLTQADDPSATT